MSETQESIRKDSAVRQVEQKNILDWSGKRVILPRGTTLPSSGRSGEVFVKVDDAGTDKLVIFDESLDHWVTVGPNV